MTYLQNMCKMVYQGVWYIITKKHKILFITNVSVNDWRNEKEWNLWIREMDMIFLAVAGFDAIRGLEQLFKCNHKAIMYLPREDHGAYLRSIEDKLSEYGDSEGMLNWKNRIVLMDDFVSIEDDIQIFTKSSKRIYKDLQDQNMILNKEGAWKLRIHNTKNEGEIGNKKTRNNSNQQEIEDSQMA